MKNQTSDCFWEQSRNFRNDVCAELWMNIWHSMYISGFYIIILGQIKNFSACPQFMGHIHTGRSLLSMTIYIYENILLCLSKMISNSLHKVIHICLYKKIIMREPCTVSPQLSLGYKEGDSSLLKMSGPYQP